MIDEIKDLKAKMDVAKCIAISGEGFDTIIVQKGTFINIPNEIDGRKIFESPLIESGKIIFVNSKELDKYGY